MRLSPVLQGSPAEILEAVHKLGLKGVVGRRLGSLYEPGERKGGWIKHRTNRKQEFVVGGYIPGTHGIDSLIVGVCEGERLMFVAKVKNGFVRRTREEIAGALAKVIVDECPFANLPETRAHRWGNSLTAEKMKGCRWVKPRLVVQVAFVEWTNAGHLRHSNFLCTRDDKVARAVVREK